MTSKAKFSERPNSYQAKISNRCEPKSKYAEAQRVAKLVAQDVKDIIAAKEREVKS
jgi:hypothetical protein